MSEKWSEKAEMSDVAFASKRIKEVVPRAHRPVKEWISVTAIRLRWPFMRTKGVWYGEARHIRAHEMADLLAAKNRKLNEARNEYQELKDRIARLETAVAVADEDFSRPFVDALRYARRGMDRTGDN